ncbi:MAG: stage V sporulation protein AB [Eubacterium sp.]|nr:stage V sporulation protein AB [Eubacterium sp.]
MTWILFFLFGGCAGSAIAGGVYAFLMKIGVYPRMIGQTHTAKEIRFYEWMIALGIIAGGVYTEFPQLTLPIGYWFVIVWGVCAGMFVGCISAALAEVLSAFPVMFRRLKIQSGMSFYMAMLAAGKTVGSLVYFWNGLR